MATSAHLSYDSSPDFPPPSPKAGQQNFGPPPAPPEPSEAWRPPLTKDLFLDANNNFGAIVLTYIRLRGILPFLRQPQSGRSVEQQLELYQNEAHADEERTRQLLSVRYYLHDLFRMVSDRWLEHTNGVTNYATLIDQIRHLNTTGDPVCLVSFNYDRLLDDALSAVDYKQQSPENHFNAHPVFKVFKPHGSVEWARLVQPQPWYKGDPAARLTPQLLIETAKDFSLSDVFVRANATEPNQMFAHPRPILPAIAVPVQTKTEEFFEWPRSHQKYFEQLLPQVTKILIIGWQGKEAHFLKLLQEKLSSSGVTQITHLQAVGRDSTEASDIAKQFIADINRHVNHLDTATRGFSHFVREEQVGFFFKN